MRFDTEKKIFIEENIDANKIAFAAADKDLTWHELKILSDKICEAFKKTNIPKTYPVLIYGDKEAFFLAAILSCYRMSLTFVPVNPSSPKNRIEKIIELTKSEILINCGEYKNIPVLPVTIDATLSQKEKHQFLFLPVQENAAYILFTSGSSGEPKGVKISDGNIIAFTKWFANNFNVNNKTVFINHADFSFDISLADFFATLQTGGTTIFNTSEISSNTNLFFERINKHKGKYWNSTPSFIFKCLSDKKFNTENLPYINQFVLSGENLSSQLVKELRNRFPNARVINAYGPTETTIYASFVEVSDDMLNEKSIPVCKTDDPTISLQENEIIISGNKVGTGYLDSEELTKQKFFIEENKKSFRTGDLAFVKNKYIYFAGRKDEQIKFNGYRIELNEIKLTLERIDFIEQAECLPVIVDEKIKRLIAFVSLTQSSPNERALIQDILKKELPYYMIPSEIIIIKKFPLTTSYKIDKQKLLSDYLAE